MDLTPYITRLQRELAVAAAAGGPEAQELASRLTAPLDSALRLVLLDVVSTAAGEITLDLDGAATVDVRLRGLDPQIVVARTELPPAATSAPAAPTPAVAPQDDDTDPGATARFSLRLPERLKPRLEAAAESAGLSVNAWLVRTVSAALDGQQGPDRGPSRPRGGWVR